MPLRIALFGQAAFGRDCLDRLLEEGHEIAGVLVPPDDRRPDPLAERAQALGLPTIRRRYFRRRGGAAIPAAVEAHAALRADLNVLASVTSIIPREISRAPARGSICFHPSLLPRFRGGSALQWQIILGERETGVTVFQVDEGVDTGPILVQRGGVSISPTDTTGSLYFDKLYPLGVEAVVEAASQIRSGAEKPMPQDESRATAQGLVDDSVAGLDLEAPAAAVDRRVRGCDPQPGAFVRWTGETVRLFDCGLEPCAKSDPPGTLLGIDEDGIRIALRDGTLRVGRVRADAGKEAAREFAARHSLRAGDRFESA
ncbi:MAG: methionyl-tRNA formyltransferase [Myxococcota bacterium]